MFWKVAFCLSLCVLVAAGFWQTPIPYTQPPVDKIIHALGFFCVSLCIFRSFAAKFIASSAILLLLLGYSIELVQEHFLPLRTFSLEDFYADAVGILIAIVVELLWRFIKYKRSLRYS